MNIFFDTIERSSEYEILKEKELFDKESFFKTLADSLPNPYLVLNLNRQIVFYNAAANAFFLNFTSPPYYGKRIGEAINCVKHCESPYLCGTSEFCSECDIGKNLKDIKINPNPKLFDCLINAENKYGNLISLSLSTKIINVDYFEKKWFIVSLLDISSKKNSEFLERIFYHDIINLAGGIYNLSNLLYEKFSDQLNNETKEIIEILNESCDHLLFELKSARDLSLAEKKELQVNLETIDIKRLFEKINRFFKNSELAFKKILLFDNINVPVIIPDYSLLFRCLVNLIKNALEASSKGQIVKTTRYRKENKIIFEVYNQNAIPRDVQLKLFKKNFSTKSDKGRGIGLFSVKIITENYLKGKVYFTSNEIEGTKFFIELPE